MTSSSDSDKDNVDGKSDSDKDNKADNNKDVILIYDESGTFSDIQIIQAAFDDMKVEKVSSESELKDKVSESPEFCSVLLVIPVMALISINLGTNIITETGRTREEIIVRNINGVSRADILKRMIACGIEIEHFETYKPSLNVFKIACKCYISLIYYRYVTTELLYITHLVA